MLKMFNYLTCKSRLKIGARRLLLVLSIPFFLFFIIPGLIFWLLVHVGIWIHDGYILDRESL